MYFICISALAITRSDLLNWYALSVISLVFRATLNYKNITSKWIIAEYKQIIYFSIISTSKNNQNKKVAGVTKSSLSKISETAQLIKKNWVHCTPHTKSKKGDYIHHHELEWIHVLYAVTTITIKWLPLFMTWSEQNICTSLISPYVHVKAGKVTTPPPPPAKASLKLHVHVH